VKSYDPAYVRELISEIQSGDGNAFASMYGITYQDQYKHAYRRLRDIYLTQDAVTETYIRAKTEVKPAAVSLEKWLTGINDAVCDHILQYADLKTKTADADRPGGMCDTADITGTDEDIPPLDDDTAEQMLYNILDTLDMPQNTVSLANLKTYTSYRQQRSRLTRTIVLVLIALLFFVPFGFIRPNMTMEKTSNADVSGRPVYTVTVNSVLETYSVTATIGGVQMPVYQESATTYSVRPTKNGKMTVVVKAENGRSVRQTVKVDTSDTKPPVLESQKVNDDHTVTYIFSDENRISFADIYEENSSGMIYYPKSWDADTGEVVFDYPSSKSVIYVPDETGNTLHLVVNP
jgi:DNA-directed RNA polymerase specialized sigma24 family protein